MKLIDVHAHLEHEKFGKDLEEVIERFKKSGGEFVISSGTDPERNRAALALAEKYDCVKCSFGMYPVGDYEDVDGELAWIEEHANVCVAIGEIGLDFNTPSGHENLHAGDEERKGNSEGQKELFRKMLGLAKKLGKVVVVHSRKAELEAIEILEDEKMDNVVMHCFNGRKSLIRRCVENGWFFSVPSVIARLEHFRMLVEMVPLGQLLTETDAPYLSPVVGERNEPVNVGVAVKTISEIKGLSEDEVAEEMFNNAKRLFGL